MSAKCAELPETTGGQEIAQLLFNLATEKTPTSAKNFTFYRLMAQDHFNRGLRHIANLGLRRLALVYRFIHPHIVVEEIAQEPPIFGAQTSSEELRPLIKSKVRFEHLVSGSSDEYLQKRKAIADAAYGHQTSVRRKK